MTKEDAIKRIKDWNLDNDKIEVLSAIIPELKESENENERVRKNCIHFLELQKGHHAATFEIDECIAWLEKQGEQKSDFCHHEVDFSNCSEEYRKAYYDGWNNCNQQHEQMKNLQKPTWSEEDEERYVSCLQRLSTGNLKQPETINTVWLKSLKERMQLQPTWNEVDEKQARQIEIIVHHACCTKLLVFGPAIQEQIADWLKSIKERMLSQQPKQQ